MENTNPQGSESLNVNQAASAFLGLMGDEGAEQGQPEEIQATEEAVEESTETEAEYAEEEVEEQPKPRYKAKVDGEEIEVDIDELINGYQRTADYTKKSQALAEQRKAIEAERVHLEQVKQERQAYAQKLQALNQFLSQQDQGENLEALKETDPIGYAVKVAERTEREKQLAVVRAEQNRIAQQQQAEHSEKLQSHIAQESQKLSSSIPGYSDPKAGDQIRKDIRDYAKSIGWTDQELANVYDSRAVLSLYHGMRYAALQKGKPEVSKKVTEAPRMMKSGVSQPRDNQEQHKKAVAQLRKTGKVRDAANAFERFV